jgi:type II secretory pathway component GspD/PulD (secretin)
VRTRPAAPERISINFRDASIQEVFDVLSRKDRLNIVLGRGVTGNVSVNLYDVTVHDAIHRIAQSGGYSVDYRDGSYTIQERTPSLPDNPASSLQLRTFKVNYSDPAQIARNSEQTYFCLGQGHPPGTAAHDRGRRPASGHRARLQNAGRA